jgi:hypothetical protein
VENPSESGENTEWMWKDLKNVEKNLGLKE